MGEVLACQSGPEALIAWEKQLSERISGQGIAADAQTASRLAHYHALLEDWNTRMNLTGDASFDVSLDRHYTDSLAPLALPGLFPLGARLIDVGSGAGFPGLPLAIARPDLKVTLLDSLQKRIAFLSAVTEALGLTNVTLLHSRAEDGGRSPHLRESFDCALARAVAPLPVLTELLFPFVRVGGRIICYKGPSAEDELTAGCRAARLVGGRPLEVIPVSLPSQPDWQHCVVTSVKYTETPKTYPRKAGIPSRNPLGLPAVKA